MSYHHRPDHTVPSDQRCEALVRGNPSNHYEWMRHDRQCCRRAQQTREGIVVCYAHSVARRVEKWTPDQS